jgi:hypothetical protein
MFKFNDGIVGPEALSQFLASNQFARPFQHSQQNLKRLFREENGLTPSNAQFTRACVELEL